MFCGIDWAEGHHGVALVDDRGKLLAKCRINDDLDGYRLLLDLLAEHGDTAETPIPVAIETSRGLLVATLRQGPRKIYAVNPRAASRYRDRHGVSRKKSDPGDALVLANIIRTDAPVHRPLPADTDLAQAVAVLARAAGRGLEPAAGCQPAAVPAQGVLPGDDRGVQGQAGNPYRPDARRILAVAPTPALAAKLQMWELTAMLRRVGRRRGIEADAERPTALPRGSPAAAAPCRGRETAECAGRLTSMLGSYLRPAVLVVDEVGYQPLERAEANLVFQVISKRYEKGSIILTSNKTFSEGGQVFGDEVLATAILDRLLHHCDVVSINGPSYRLKNRLAAIERERDDAA
ncbi:ATP-binding protein [Streptomyces sp. NPDC048349]|uniref:ATP-binding protein n=1 Tax=Streptomyces sp. NPDC048349 TaxID=3155486 RepID=UPI003440E54C